MTTASTLTAEEMFESLTGFEEIAIAKAFGSPIVALSKADSITWARALAFIHIRRDEVADAAAKTRALSLTIGELRAFFAEDSAADLGDDGLGKAEAPTGPTPAASPSGSSSPASPDPSTSA